MKRSTRGGGKGGKRGEWGRGEVGGGGRAPLLLGG